MADFFYGVCVLWSLVATTLLLVYLPAGMAAIKNKTTAHYLIVFILWVGMAFSWVLSFTLFLDLL